MLLGVGAPNGIVRERTIVEGAPNPGAIRVDSAGVLVFNSNIGSDVPRETVGGTLAILDPKSFRVIDAKCEGFGGFEAAITDDAHHLYVLNGGNGVDFSGGLMEMDVPSGRITRSISVPDGVYGSALALDGNANLYAALDDAAQTAQRHMVVQVYRPGATAPFRTIRVPNRITDLATDDRSLYVAEQYPNGTGCICVYSLADGTLARTVSDGIRNPAALVLDRSGDLYVANASDVTVYAKGGQTRTRTIVTGASPSSLSFDSRGDLLIGSPSAIAFVAPGQNAAAFKIVAAKGSAFGPIAIDRNDRLYVGESDSISVLDIPAGASLHGAIAYADIPDGEARAQPANPSASLASPANARLLEPFPDGTVWFAGDGGPNAQTIGQIKSDGSVSTKSISTSGEIGGLAPAPDRAMWLSLTKDDKIDRVDASGAISTFALPANSGPTGIVAGPDGAMWFVEYGQHAIGRITNDGNVTRYPVKGTFGPSAHGIAAGPDGAIWFAEDQAVGRLTTDGRLNEFATQGSLGGSIVAGPDSAMWFSHGNAISRIASNGVIRSYPMNCTVFVGDVLGAYGGAIWFSEKYHDRIGRITTDGKYTTYVFPTTLIPPPLSPPNPATISTKGVLWYSRYGSTAIEQQPLSDLTSLGVETTSYRLLGIFSAPPGSEDVWRL